MTENKNFQFAVLISMLIHFSLFLGMPHNPFLPNKRSLYSIKITYCKVKEIKVEEPKKLIGIKPETIRPIVKNLPEIKKEDMLKKTEPKPQPKSEKKEPEVSKQAGTQLIKEVKEKKFEAIIDEEENTVRKATYISYYRAVREKIRECADRKYPKDRSSGEGEVFLSFVVASNGELLQVKVVDSKSIDDSLLRDIAINSIRDANPFSAFPQGMNQYQITFNVIISFELSK